ncbi:craniofacial development protein 2-like [Chrysoperla carnea]|uniref:craniofacial development protein 2-like n=1 Tax=Chrysoperla carnea TaxID=189513 RepID=UPI001D06F364|nr:craniofacial development protein 2-like [Chrysoperla carnea]
MQKQRKGNDYIMELPMDGSSKPPSYTAQENHSLQKFKNRNSQTKEKVKYKTNLQIGTWNVKTMYQSGKLSNITKEMKRLNVDILGVCETRLTGVGKFQTDDYWVLYSGGETHDYGVGFILKKNVYNKVTGFWNISNEITMITLSCKPHNVVLIMVYAPTAGVLEENADMFYEQLEMAYSQV